MKSYKDGMIWVGVCDFCGYTETRNVTTDCGIFDGWWTLNGYHKLWGFCCPTCWEGVRHINGKPTNPAAYRRIQVQYELLRSVNS